MELVPYAEQNGCRYTHYHFCDWRYLAWGGFNQGLEHTNTEQFCSDCHMNDVVPEYRASAHYSNRSGVKAICSDCHVPHEFLDKWKRKIIASKEVYAHFTGKVDTKENLKHTA
ncbi:nitrate/TMAO reductase, membrane-bound tetraheme cytochrome c subunit [Actinobacillus equuli]|nr:nitrate/TMAO reductase, membrane-bound tetraheme cytochrome c subunit [Actinobacillus equuli]